MNIPSIILTVLGIVAAAGVATAYFRRSVGRETIGLLQDNITAYKDAERLKDKEIAYLRGQLEIKERIIEGLVRNGADTRSRKSQR